MNMIRILIVVALQSAALGYMIVDRQTMLNAGRVVTLKVVPVDPRDIFRGDYVILSYEISRLEPAKLQGDDKFIYGETVYVTLVREGDAWNAAAIAKDRPVALQGGVPLRGTVQNFETAEGGNTSSLTVSYGIESYFVPEGTGRALEDERQKGGLSIDVAVDSQGRGAIKALRRGGQVFYVEGVF